MLSGLNSKWLLVIKLLGIGCKRLKMRFLSVNELIGWVCVKIFEKNFYAHPTN